MSPLHRILTTVAAALAATPAAAHEFWLMPSAFRCETDTLLRVEMFHGERFAGDVVPRNDPKIARFELVQQESTTPVRGLHGSAAGLLRPEDAGPGVIVFESHEYLNDLDGPAFEAYLEEEGLDTIRSWRKLNGRTDEPGREAYVRCAKALVGIDGDAADEAVGLPYEIVLDEAGLGSGSARVLFGGEPLEGARVVLVSAEDPDTLIELESGSEGVVEFAPSGGGAWMLTSLHMERQSARDDVDWKSYWASLTFEIPADGTAG